MRSLKINVVSQTVALFSFVEEGFKINEKKNYMFAC